MSSQAKNPQPKTPIDVDSAICAIIRTSEPPSEHVEYVQSMGLTVTHTYSLVPGMAVRGSAKMVMTLAAESWVSQIEIDHPLHTIESEVADESSQS